MYGCPMTLPTVASDLFTYQLLRGPNLVETIDLITAISNGSCGYTASLLYQNSALVDGTPAPFSTELRLDGTFKGLRVDLDHGPYWATEYEFELLMSEVLPDPTRSKSLTFKVKLEYICDHSDLILPD